MTAALTNKQTDFRALSVCLAFLCTAAAYALPFWLFPTAYRLNGPMSPEIVNLYAFVSWMGIAHFVYAYHGQAMALKNMPAKIVLFLSLLALGAVALICLRAFMGWMLFSVAMWIYFIPHFVKAELHFGNVLEAGAEQNHGWSVYWFPTLTFAFVAFALFMPMNIVSNHWLVLLLAIGITVLGIIGGALRALNHKSTSGYMVLAFFLLAEGLVWATYRKYMSFQFQQGVFVFHVALASFYHYFRSYDFALRTKFNEQPQQKTRYLCGIALTNATVVATGAFCLQTALVPWLFDVYFFTFWVGLHQLSSDLFSVLRNRPSPRF